MLLRLFGLGFKRFIEDNFNIYDAGLVAISLFELFMGDQVSAAGVSVLRAFRLVRVFKLIRSWVLLRKLLNTVMESLSTILNMGVLTLLFIFISALLAKQLFSETSLVDDDGLVSRYSF